MTIIRDAMEFIQGLTKESLQLTCVDKRQLRQTFLTPQGQRIDVDIEPPPRLHHVFTLGDLKEAVERWNVDGTIWHLRNKVEFICDDDTRVDRIVLDLDTTDIWDEIAEIAKLDDGRRFDQRSLLRFLRFKLRDYIQPTIVAAIQKIEVVTSGKESKEINPGRERGTREFAADLAASGEIPEVLEIMTPMYAIPGIDHCVPVRLGLDYTLPPQPVTFTLEVLPDELLRAEMSVQATLHQWLVENVEVPVFYGTP